MKTRISFFFGSLVLIAMTHGARAANLTWDTTSGDGSTITASSGTWDLTAGNLVWNNAGANPNLAWTQTSASVATNSAFFAGTDTGSKTITVATGVATSGLTFNNSGYTLSASTAQTVNITGVSAQTLTLATGKSATIGTNVTVVGASSTLGLTLAGAGTLNISGTGAKVQMTDNNITLSSGPIVNVTSGATMTTNSQIVIGTSATSTLLAVDGGTVAAGKITGSTSAQNIVLANASSGTVAATLTLTSGSVTNNGTYRTTGESGLRFGSTTAGGTISGTVNLDGGTLTVARVYEGNAGVTSSFNFNGGTLKVTTGALNAANFMSGLDSANVKEGGAKIDTNNIATTVDQSLVHGGVAVTDGGLIKIGSGTLTLTGNNTYTGTTEVQVGTLSLGRVGGTLLDSGAVNVNGGILDVANADTVGAVTLTSGTISGAATLTGSSYTLKSGTVSAQLAGVGIALTKNTSGTVTLGGTQTYTGATSIDAGTLNVTGSLASAINVNAGGTLGGEGSTSGSLNFGAGTSFFNFDASTGTSFTAASVSVDPGALVLLSPSGSGNSRVLTNSAGFAGGVVPAGFAPTARGTLTLSNANKDLDFTPTGAASLKWTGANGTNPSYWDTVNTLNWSNGGTPDRFYSNDAVTFDDTASSFSVVVQGVSATTGAVVFDNSANAYTLGGSNLTGTTLSKSGTNTLTISNSNSFPGGATINAGTLQLGNGSAATGSISGAILNNAALVTNYGTNNVTVANDISGSGSLTQSGSGTVTLTGTNSYGATTINSGTLQVGSGGTSGTLGSGAVTNNATLAFSRSDASTVSNAIGGTGAVTKLGGGTINLSSANTYSGTTTVSAGGLIVSANDALGSATSGTSVTPGSSLGFSGGITYSTAEKITGSGVGTTVANSGALVAVQRGFVQSVSGNNTFAGNIEITAGGTTRIGTQDGAQLTLTGSITRATGVTGVQMLFRAGGLNGDFVTLANSGNSWDTDALIFTNAPSGAAGVRLGVDNPLPITQTITGASSNSAATTLDLNGYNQTLNGLINSTAINAATLSISNSNTGQTSTLTLNPSVDKTAGAGVNATTINNGAGLVAVVKTGSFNQTFNGTHTYTGGTRIDGGTLTLGHATNTLADTGAVNVNGGTLAIGANSDTVGAVTLTSGSITGGSGVLTGSGYTFKSGTVSAILGGSGVALTKDTSGSVTLSGNNTYTGATTVSGGTLVVNGNISTSVLTTVQSGATLGGSGTVGDLTVESGGTVAPGNSPGILTTGNYNQAGTLGLELNGTSAGSTYDQLNVSGTVTLSGLLAATVGYTPVDGDLLFILTNDSTDAISGTFAGVADLSNVSLGGYMWQISYQANYTGSNTGTFTGGNDIALMAVPEPAAALLGSLGLLCLLRRRR